MKPLIAAIAFLAATACANRGVTISHTPITRPVSEAGKVTRGRDVVYRAPVTIENAQVLPADAYQDLQNHFLLPLQLGPWRYVIEGITLDAEAAQDREWTLLIALDTGAHVKVENFGAWDESTQSYFRGGYRRTLRALEEIRATDPALDRYIRFWSPKRRKRQVEVSADRASEVN
jgi:hypothetical protein